MGIGDRELITKLQQGSLEALGVLYDRYQHMVFRTALAITGDPDAAADLQQDVFLRLFRFAKRVDAERPLEPWLYRVTANLAYTWVKRHNRWVRPFEDLAEWVASGFRSSPVQQMEIDETNEQIYHALLSLPLTHRVVVALYYLNDLSLQEISEILEIPVGTVKSRLHYGRLALKQYLGLRGEPLPGDQLADMDLGYEFT
jgi:RNA polymerase sigma-70 factor (ECF subfamily)